MGCATSTGQAPWFFIAYKRELRLIKTIQVFIQNLRYEEKGVKVGALGDISKKEDIRESNPN